MCRAPLLIRNYLDTPEMKNLIGVASRGRKLRNCKVRALETSIVQYRARKNGLLLPRSFFGCKPFFRPLYLKFLFRYKLNPVLVGGGALRSRYD